MKKKAITKVLSKLEISLEEQQWQDFTVEQLQEKLMNENHLVWTNFGLLLLLPYNTDK